MQQKKVIIVDDEQLYINSLLRAIKRTDFINDLNISSYNSVDDATNNENLEQINIALIDLNMPIKNGKELVKELLKLNNPPYIIVITGEADIKIGADLLNSGIYDYFLKTRDFTDLLIKLKHILLQIDKDKELEQLKKDIGRNKNFLIHDSGSRSMLKTIKTIEAATNSTFPVLILGESGTGKEIIADYIHNNGSLSKEALIKVNSAGIVSTLMESEMFGHEKGSFTGAISQKKGKFEEAAEGTLFLDEIGDMPMELQVKLLRTLQDGSFQRVGSSKTLYSNARIISATNKDIYKEIEKHNFREDLFYRLNIITINLPPLRERKEDIPILIQLFLDKLNIKYKRNTSIDSETVKFLSKLNYPGNIRELENIIASSFALCQEEVIGPQDLPDYLLKMEDNIKYNLTNSLKETMMEIESRIIQDILKDSESNKVEAAEKLGISRKHLYNKIQKYNLE